MFRLAIFGEWTTMVSIKDAAWAFLANKRIAVTGAPRNAQGHISNIVYRRLRDRG